MKNIETLKIVEQDRKYKKHRDLQIKIKKSLKKRDHRIIPKIHLAILNISKNCRDIEKKSKFSKFSNFYKFSKGYTN